MEGQPFLENLAHPARGLAEPQRRDAGGAVERAHEIGEIAEADVIGDVGDRTVVIGQPPRRMAQPRAHQILVRRDAERVREQPQEMERADAGLGGCVLQVDRLVRMGIDPQRRFHRAAAIAGGIRPGLARLARNHLDEAAGQHLPDLVETDVAAAICRRLRQLAQHHQFRQRRCGTDLPDRAAVADRLHQLGVQEKRQALVAADVVMRAGIFVAGMADQHRSRHQLAGLAAAAQAETAFAHIGNRVARMQFRERLVIRPGIAAELGHADGFAF